MAAPARASQDPPATYSLPSAAGSTSTSLGLRTFTVDKPLALIETQRKSDTSHRQPLRLPRAHDTVRTTVGLGYVQGADWASELLAAGEFKGIQVQTNALVTKGSTGVLFDSGSLSLFDPDRHWRFEGGDVFSNLRGVSRGGRLSWQSAGGRRPAISIYGPRPGTPNRPTVISYRDQIVVGEQTLIDAEIASDRSYLLRSRLVRKRFEIEPSYRSNRRPVPSRDASVFGGVTIWRGVGVNAGLFRSVQAGDRSEWRTLSLRVPLSRLISLTLERAFAAANGTSNTTSAAMASLNAGQLRLFHRHQFGEYDLVRPGFSESVERQQTQSMASYMPSRRLNLTLQLATQRTETGQIQHWEELQTTISATRTTTLRFVTAVPDIRNEQRFRAHFRQELPAHFALQADYGRLSAFQAVPFELDRARVKVMLYKSWRVATPARGAEVRGRVVDHAGRPVSGARVKLGSYTTDTGVDGGYLFRNVPKGDYPLTLDPEFLPADYAWDGRQLPLALSWSSRTEADLLVAPLNAIHGRAYNDRNANGRFDSGEEMAGVVIHLQDRVTATDQQGAYSFYNLWPGTFTLRVNREKLSADVEVIGSDELSVVLGDGHPVTGADFRLQPKTKPIIFGKPGK
jgi:hypothetical protein